MPCRASVLQCLYRKLYFSCHFKSYSTSNTIRRQTRCGLLTVMEVSYSEYGNKPTEPFRHEASLLSASDEVQWENRGSNSLLSFAESVCERKLLLSHFRVNIISCFRLAHFRFKGFCSQRRSASPKSKLKTCHAQNRINKRTALTLLLFLPYCFV